MKVIDEHDVTVHQGDVRQQLAHLDTGSAQCIVTSPPYFGLRDYGVDGQLGLEPSPAEYVAVMVDVFREARRVLADDGVLWLNLGDSYSSSPPGKTDHAMRSSTLDSKKAAQTLRSSVERANIDRTKFLPEKNLLGIPWRVAFALQDDDGSDVYELRGDAPESVRALYLETCHTKTRTRDANITASTPGSGEKPTASNTEQPAANGTTPTETSCADTAGSTTNSTASKKFSEQSGAMLAASAVSDSKHCSTTADSIPSATAAPSIGSRSSASITSTVADHSTGANYGQPTSTCGNGSGASSTPTDSASCATTATQRSGSTATARTTRNARLLKSEIRPADLAYFRLVKPDRWILRNAVIWNKPNAMPESVTDRLSTRYEHVFLFSKSRRYTFDLDAIREPHGQQTGGTGGQYTDESYTGGTPHKGLGVVRYNAGGRNPGDVWSITTSPFAGAHFATMPPKLAERCILAGCTEGATVLDPFAGSGTTLMVARRLNRKAVGIELNPDYVQIIRDRIGPAPFDFGEASA